MRGENYVGLVLAAGFGTRLGAITQKTPKCLVEIGGRPLLYWVLKRLEAAGIKTVVVNTHYLRDQVAAFLSSAQFGEMKTVESHEPVIADHGGAIREALKHVKGDRPFLVHNADIYTDASIEKVMEGHEVAGNHITFGVLAEAGPRPMLFDKEMRFAGLRSVPEKTEKRVDGVPVDRALGYGCIAVFGPEVFPFFRSDPRPSFGHPAKSLEAAQQGHRVGGVLMEPTIWGDIGTPDELEKMRKIVGNQK